MSLKGNIKGEILQGNINGEILQGNINRLHELRGYSAYEVAVLEGFEGTKEEWLASLVGPQGDRGNPGVYLGSGEMPEDCNVQIDPNGEVLEDVVTHEELEEALANIGGGGGADGFSPVATVTQTDSGATITITDKNGTTTATITNGKDGYSPQKGIDYFDGEPGADGYSPVRGEDYWTEADKAEMVADVISALPVYNGEVVE